MKEFNLTKPTTFSLSKNWTSLQVVFSIIFILDAERLFFRKNSTSWFWVQFDWSLELAALIKTELLN